MNRFGGNVLVRVALVLTVVLGLAWPVPTSAADAQRPKAPLHLTTSPLPINLMAEPGHSVSTDIRVKQEGGATERLKVSLLKFTAFGEEGKPRLLDRGPGDDYFDWVKFDKPEFDAPNNQWQTVKMTINVPKSGAFGYYYGVVFSRVGDDIQPSGNTNAIAGGTAVLVLLDVNVPGAKRKLDLTSFAVDHRVVEFLPSSFSVKFTNNGNVHVKPSGNIFVMSGTKQIGSIILNTEQGNVLPGTKRIYQIGWTDGFPHYQKAVENGKSKLDRKGNQIQTLDWSFQTPEAEASNGQQQSAVSGNSNPLAKIRFGRYRAHLFVVYDDGHGRDIPIESEIAFWVIPWRPLIVLLMVLLLVGFGIYSMVRGTLRRTRSQRRQR